MMRPLRETTNTLRASPVFATLVLVTLAVVGLIELMVSLMALRLNSLLPGPFAHMAHFTEANHRVHDLTFGFVFVPAIAGMLAQLRRPSTNVAGMLMALAPWIGLLLAAVLSTSPLVILSAQSLLPAVLIASSAVLHPTGREFFRSFRRSRVNWLMLGLVVVAAVPLLVFASSNIGLQATVADDHAGMGHYGFMAAFGFTVVAVGGLAGLRPDGWRLTAWVAGLLPALLGLTSLVYPDVPSSLSLGWALAAITWGVLFVAAAELTKAADGSTLLGARGVLSRSARG
jgi:hypothetical protein